MIIHRYKKEDKEQLIKLIEDCLYQIFEVKPKKIELDNGLLEKDGILYVAEDKGKIIGSVGIKRQKRGIARLKKMYVAKNYRKKGLGQKLYDKAESFAEKQGYKNIILSTTSQMKEAIAFYSKNGFKYYRKNKKKNQLFFKKRLK